MSQHLLQDLAPFLAAPVVRKPTGASASESGAELSIPFGPPLLPPFAADGDE